MPLYEPFVDISITQLTQLCLLPQDHRALPLPHPPRTDLVPDLTVHQLPLVVTATPHTILPGVLHCLKVTSSNPSPQVSQGQLSRGGFDKTGLNAPSASEKTDKVLIPEPEARKSSLLQLDSFCTNSLGRWLDSGHPKFATAKPRGKTCNSLDLCVPEGIQGPATSEPLRACSKCRFLGLTITIWTEDLRV